MFITAPPYIPTNKLKDPEIHITRIGKILRKTSLDELPQIYNILIKDMSLVGPRPVIPEEVELIQKRKLLGVDQILPGVTGLAQINGRDELDYEEKSGFDYQYLTKMSFILDLSIIINTAIKICKSEHISH